ncbi:hypothetical protein HCH_02361 [Hahella chejuensis KCTC 2396]|uniref:Uncharacterized protein n=1 Tax=Hahella chejuensis (strain KCTC 2396) TaxID=349521 RepID=Q2SJJ2_HAHCH|nr:hypothetical protein HCH_02361 [Hahella chejuensis KCTC 2396]
MLDFLFGDLYVFFVSYAPILFFAFVIFSAVLWEDHEARLFLVSFLSLILVCYFVYNFGGMSFVFIFFFVLVFEFVDMYRRGIGCQQICSVLWRVVRNSFIIYILFVLIAGLFF